ncbi:hypothetical protein M9M90_11530 [Phenylobacterium sp. LH3H17]|uniref:hypothetical protein n=1 Tax=Phenylobacterium sp. LH3H17 TaxID=2903901 RepID=UPI0020C9A0C4|nr:hypothetical protein [Phenylobacterium sp. LH3H17]UTP37871.1 hypothetical protein M9M90_11530 [Phenylobacterium sp. LH3H17]
MVATTMGAERAETRWFYVGMAAVFAVIAFGGFIPTYWSKLATGTFGGAPILHIHGLIFFTWTLFYLVQTSLVALGRTYDHRNWGLAGIALATGMCFTVVLAAINSIKVAETIGMGDQARQFSIVSLTGIVLFAGLFGTAIANNTRADVHKRLMLLSMIPLMEAASARVFMVLLAPPGAVGPPPVQVTIPPSIFVDLLIVVAMVYDWRTRGRPHPVYLWGGGAIVLHQIGAIALAGTPGWMAVATWVESLTG